MIKLIKSTYYNEKDTSEKLCKFIKSAKMLSFGPECLRFEKNLARWHKRKHAVFLNSGSSGNLAMLQALINTGRIKPGDKIGFSALTWSTNVMPIIQLGLRPVPIDVELETLNISSTKLEEVLNKHKLKVMFITNLLGFCDDIDRIKKICDNLNIILLEDNCESLGTVYKKKLLGNYGFASSCSFYVGHHMSTIEGGCVLTDDEEFATMLRIVRAHGWDRNLSTKRQTKIRNEYKVNSTFYSRYTFYDLGYNFRPMEINAFIGNLQIKYLNKIIKLRNKNYFYLAPKIYKNTDKYFPIKSSHIDFLSNFAIPVVCKSQEIRDRLVKICDGKLEIRPIVGGDMTRQPFFSKYVSKDSKFASPNARLVHEQGFYFGNNPELTKKELNTILNLLA